MHIKYPSLVVLVAVCWICLFAKINVSPFITKITKFTAPSVFSIYLIHDNMYFRTYLVSERLAFLNNFNYIITFVSIIAVVVAVFLFCFAIDLIRRGIFEILHIDSLVTTIEDFIKKIIKFISKCITNKINVDN